MHLMLTSPKRPLRRVTATAPLHLFITIFLFAALGHGAHAAGDPAPERILLVSRVGRLTPKERQIITRLIAALKSPPSTYGPPLSARIDRALSKTAEGNTDAKALIDAIAHGRELFIEGDYAHAIATLRPAIQALGHQDALLATDGQLRAPLQRGLLFLAHAYLRSKKNDRAIATMTEAIRLFPNTHPLLARYGPDLVKLFRQVNNDLRRQPRVTLTLRSKTPGCSVFLNGRYIGVTPTHARKLLPGRYRVYMQRPNARGRVHLIDLSGTDRELVIDHTLDAALATSPPVGLRYASSRAQHDHEHDHALAVARATGADGVILMGFVQHLGRRVLQGQVLGAATGRVLRSGLVAVTPPPSTHEISALASFLLSGKEGKGIIIGTAKTLPPSPHDTSENFMSPHVWRWISLGLGLALTGAGIPLIAIDGKGTCGEDRCPNTYQTLTPGIILSAAGGAALITSVVFFVLDARSAPVSFHAAHARRWAHIAPWLGPHGVGINTRWHF